MDHSQTPARVHNSGFRKHYAAPHTHTHSWNNVVLNKTNVPLALQQGSVVSQFMALWTAFFQRAKRNSLSVCEEDRQTGQTRRYKLTIGYNRFSSRVRFPHRQSWSEARISRMWCVGGDRGSSSTRSPPLLPPLPWPHPELWSRTWWVALDHHETDETHPE